MERGDDWVSDLYDNYSPDSSEVGAFGFRPGIWQFWALTLCMLAWCQAEEVVGMVLSRGLGCPKLVEINEMLQMCSDFICRTMNTASRRGCTF